MEFLTRFKNALFLIAVLLAQALGLAVQVRSPVNPAEPDGPSVRLLRLWATGAVTPFERAVHAVGWGTKHGWSDYVDLRHVRQENEDLQKQLTRMRVEQASIAEDALQGRRLQNLLGFREQYVTATVAAQVIGTSGSEQSHVLLIDKGSHDGLRPDMAVMTQDGIVGKLRDVFPTTSQVLEINDQTAGAGVILGSTRVRAILRGTVTGGVQIGNLLADSRIKPGETVLTSGGDQVFPRGLAVGTVESIAPDPEHQPYVAIVVRPAVRLAQVEEVLVITGTQPDLPAQAQQDLSAAAARHAADEVAEPLPGVFDQKPGTVTGDAGAPASAPAPPKPMAPVHADRFSIGATPSAAELTPGAARDKTSDPGVRPSRLPAPRPTAPAGSDPGAAPEAPKRPAAAPVDPQG